MEGKSFQKEEVMSGETEILSLWHWEDDSHGCSEGQETLEMEG